MQNMKKKPKLQQFSIRILAVYCIIMLVFWLCANEQLNYRMDTSDMLKYENAIGEIMPDTVFTQKFRTSSNSDLLSITFPIATYGRNNNCELYVCIYDGEQLLAEKTISALNHPDSQLYELTFDSPIYLQASKYYTISITSPNANPENTVSIYMGKTYAAGKTEIEVDLTPEMQVCRNGISLGYSLCYSLSTRTHLDFGKYFPFAAMGAGVVLALYLLHMNICAKKNKKCRGLQFLKSMDRYRYLLKQLVTRDFKTKYKRSVLGIIWSFLNPLLMMTVQYVVFSTLFQNTIDNFALYLIIGIVCFNFFNECATLCLTSITGNATLITKVYVPKYIYPVSRMLSSCVNLMLSLIPLFLVLIFTGTGFSKSMFLLPIPIVCLAAFSLGIGMILSTMMVFFRDTQFLWGVVSMIWMYVTPIIYPESILPNEYLFLFKLNPLYHILRMTRIMFMQGISPEPRAYLISIILSFGTLFIGGFIFNKQQDKFVLNL